MVNKVVEKILHLNVLFDAHSNDNIFVQYTHARARSHAREREKDGPVNIALSHGRGEPE